MRYNPCCCRQAWREFSSLPNTDHNVMKQRATQNSRVTVRQWMKTLDAYLDLQRFSEAILAGTMFQRYLRFPQAWHSKGFLRGFCVLEVRKLNLLFCKGIARNTAKKRGSNLLIQAGWWETAFLYTSSAGKCCPFCCSAPAVYKKKPVP